MTDEICDFSPYTLRLTALKREVERAVDLVKNTALPVELDQNKVGRLSRMDAMQGQEMAKATVERQSLLLTQIRRALEDIDSGEYGRCVECDEIIASARLMVDPVVQTCIVCATQLERV